MEKSKILEELDKWNKIAETNDQNNPLLKEIYDEIIRIELKMFQYYMNKYDKNELIKNFQAKNIVNDKGELIIGRCLSLTNKTKNFGYVSNIYYLNPQSANMLYKAYLEFADGNINENIRQEINYENISYDELENLNPYEIIYWCYIHDITFEEFAKMNFIHECSHKFGIAGGEELDDPYLFNIFAEGVTEKLARNFAKDSKLPYIPIFRNMELEFVNHFFEEDMDMILEYALNGKSYDVIANSLFYLYQILDNEELSYTEKWMIISNTIGETYEIIKMYREKGCTTEPTDSFITIFDKQKNALTIEYVKAKVEEAISKLKEQEPKPTM